MHSAWKIHEIVGEIASYLGVASLRKLAVTCRTLYPPCEEALWALQGSLKPLMRFLPPDLIRFESFGQIADDVSAPVAATHDHALLPETFSQTKQPIQYGVEQQGGDTEAGLSTAVRPGSLHHDAGSSRHTRCFVDYQWRVTSINFLLVLSG